MMKPPMPESGDPQNRPRRSKIDTGLNDGEMKDVASVAGPHGSDRPKAPSTSNERKSGGPGLDGVIGGNVSFKAGVRHLDRMKE